MTVLFGAQAVRAVGRVRRVALGVVRLVALARLQLTRGDAVRSILSAASGAFVALTPLAVVADRGKDLYESDRSILSGGMLPKDEERTLSATERSILVSRAV